MRLKEALKMIIGSPCAWRKLMECPKLEINMPTPNNDLCSTTLEIIILNKSMRKFIGTILHRIINRISKANERINKRNQS